MLKSDLKRVFSDRMFGIAVLGILMLCAMSQVYSSADGTTSFVKAIFLPRDVLTSDYSYSRFFAFMSFHNSYAMRIMLPLLAGLPFVSVYCDERKSGYMRFAISRVGKRKYYGSKLFSCVITASSVMLAGVLLYGLLVLIFMPSAAQCGIDNEQFSFMLSSFYKLGQYGAWVVITARAIASVFGAIFGGLFCLVCAAVVPNKYLALCIPVLIYDALGSVSSVITRAIMSGELVGSLKSKVAIFIAPYNMMVADTLYTPTWMNIIYITIPSLLLAFVYWLITHRRRVDCCD